MIRAFPPDLVPVLRDRRSAAGALAEIDDDHLVQLLTTVFFAGLETYEGEHGAIRVVLVSASCGDIVIPEGTPSGAPPVYCWKLLRFTAPRPFTASELVKLAVASANERLYAAVFVRDGELEITGLAREGIGCEVDPFIQVVASRPGCLSIRAGRNRLVEYERGAIVPGGDNVVLAEGPVRDTLEAAASAAGIDPDRMPDYLRAVHALVGEMAAHGRGGILVISSEAELHVAKASRYRMTLNSSISAMLRLSRRIRRGEDSSSYGFLLANAFQAEAQHMIEEYGGLTAIDGATLLNRELALVAFGVILPVGPRIVTVEMAGDRATRGIGVGSRGTRHRASATYAVDHPGSVVFVASEDGEVSCMLADPEGERVLVWRLGPGA